MAQTFKVHLSRHSAPNTTFRISIYHFYELEATTSMSSQQPPQKPAAAPAVAPAAASTAVPAKAKTGNAVTMPVDGAHHSKDMMHSSHANRNFDLPSLESINIGTQGAASINDPEPKENAVIQNNIKNLNFPLKPF